MGRLKRAIDPKTGVGRRRLVGLVLFTVIFGAFFGLNRFPKLDIVREDVDIATAGQAVGIESDETRPGCFQGFCVDDTEEAPLLNRWWDFSMTYIRLVAVGMVFAFLVAGLAETFLLSSKERTGFRRRGVKGSLEGLTVGPAMTLCSACIVPVADSFRKRGASVESTIALAQGSSTLNLPAILMTVAVFTPMLAVSRICLSVAGALLIGPAVAYIVDKRRDDQGPTVTDTLGPAPYEETPSWSAVLWKGISEWFRSSFRFFVRLAPIMVIAGFASGLAIQWLTPDSVSLYLGDHLLAIAIAATVGVLINVPLMFEIPLVAAMMLLGMGTAPAATLLFAAAAAGPITFWGLAKHIPVRGVAAYAASTWILAALGGVTVLGIGALLPI